jgi:hypothetical protein
MTDSPETSRITELLINVTDGGREAVDQLVELRYFAGLTIKEVAEVVGISEATVVCEWTIAQAWLLNELSAHSHSKKTV